MAEQRASKKQQELLSFVDGFIKGNGYGPSYREIMRALDYRSVSTVAIHIDGLIAKGYLARRDKSARSLEVVTTRPHEEDPTPLPRKSVSEELLAIIAKAELADEERRSAAEVFERLGLNDIATSLKDSDEATK